MSQKPPCHPAWLPGHRQQWTDAFHFDLSRLLRRPHHARAHSPYNTRGARTTRNDSDNLYGGRAGRLFDLSQNSGGSNNADLSIGLSV